MPAEGGYSAGSIFLQVVPSFAGFEAAARREAKKMEAAVADGLDNGAERGSQKAKEHIKDALGSPDIKKTAQKTGRDAGSEMGGAFQSEFNRFVDRAIKDLGTSADHEIRILKGSLKDLRDKKLGIDIDSKGALAAIGLIEREVRRLSEQSADIDVRVNAASAAAELQALHRQVNKLDGMDATVDVNVDTKRATRELSLFNKLIGRTGSQAEDTANSFRAFNGMLLAAATAGPALVPVLAAIAGGLVALGPAAVAATAGLGTLAIGFSGITDAVKALNDVQNNAAKDQDAFKKKLRNSSETVSNAERRLAKAVADAGRQREDAKRRVVDAEESAARSIQSALRRQQDAEKNLSDAQKDATKAQLDLREARREAQRDLDAIADRQKQTKLDERQALIDLFNAQVDYNAVQADAGSTNLEREQASINLEQARLRLAGIRKEEKELSDERKKGINGSEKVQSAEERVAQAIERQKEAQQSLKDATQEVRDTQVQAARDVADAYREQQQAGVDAADRIHDAQTALTQAQEDYKQALYETGTLGSASMQKLQQAMSVLGPAGQEFARFIFGLRDEFYAIRNAVQAGLFPGLTEAISILVKTYLPSFTQFMGELGKVFGDIARLTAETLTNDTWKQFFSVFRLVSPELIRNYSVVFLNLATVMAQLATVAAPFAVAFSRGLVSLTQKAVDFMSSAEGQQMWLDFFETVKKLAKPVLGFFEALIPAFLALVGALIPVGTLVLQALTGILNWIAALDPKVLQGIVTAILTLVIAFQAASAAAIILQAATAAFSTPIGLAIAAIVALVGIITYLYTTNETARKIIDEVWHYISTIIGWYIQHVTIPFLKIFYYEFKFAFLGIKWLWENVLWPAIKALGDAIMWVWNVIIKPAISAFAPLVSKIFRDIGWAWNNILWPVIKVMAKIVWELWSLGFKVAFDAIKLGFSALATGLKWTWEHLIFPVINFFAKALGVDLNGKSLKSGLVAAFQIAATLIGKAWDTLKDLSKAPIKFVLETVLNKGLIGGFNWLAGKLGMDKIDPIPLPEGFARGGVYGVRPGYTPGRDTHMIAVSGGEGILRPELTRALGHDWVYAANAAARTGGVRGASRFLGGFKNGGVVWPVSGYGVGTQFGVRGPRWSSGYHTGVDFPAPIGTPIHAAMGGRISGLGWSSWGGNLMRIITQGLGEWFYAHQSRFAPGLGINDMVSAGQLLGYVGATGNVTGPHLHLELRVGGTPVDPMRTLTGGATGIGEKEAVQNQSRLEKILSGLGNLAGAVKDAVANPLNWLKSKVEGPIDSMVHKFGDNWLTQGLRKIPDKFFGALVDRIKGLVGAHDEAMVNDVPVSEIQRLVQQMAVSKYGWSGSQWSALNWLVNKESSWNPLAQNPTSTAFGLFQFLDGTWKGYGPKTSDPRLQAEYGLEYIHQRYGNPENAKRFHEAHGWYSEGGVVPGGLPDNGTMMYDNGGYLPPGLTTVVNLTGKPEPVFTADQFERMGGGGGQGFTYAPTFNQSDLTPDDVMDDFRFEYRRFTRGS